MYSRVRTPPFVYGAKSKWTHRSLGSARRIIQKEMASRTKRDDNLSQTWRRKLRTKRMILKPAMRWFMLQRKSKTAGIEQSQGSAPWLKLYLDSKVEDVDLSSPLRWSFCFCCFSSTFQGRAMANTPRATLLWAKLHSTKTRRPGIAFAFGVLHTVIEYRGFWEPKYNMISSIHRKRATQSHIFL